MTQAFITGATGFLGSHIARVLLQAGHSVRVLRRANSKLDALNGLDVEHVIGDLFDIDQLAEQMRGCAWVFHVAAVADYWRSSKAEIYRVNVDGTQNLLEAAQRAGVGRFIFTSSVAAVGRAAFPADEQTYFNLDPRLTPYGHSKFLAEAAVRRAGLEAVILNPAVILGPGDINQISGSLIIEIARGGQPFLPQTGGTNFIDVRDVAQAHLAAAQQGRAGERYILGAVNMTHKAFTKLVCEVVGQPLPIIPAPGVFIPVAAALADLGRAFGANIPAEGNQLRLSRMNLYVNTDKMRAELCEPQIDIWQSVQDTYDWYCAQGIITR